MDPLVLHSLTITYMEAGKLTLTGEKNPDPHQQNGDEQDQNPYQYDFCHIVRFYRRKDSPISQLNTIFSH